MRTHRTSSNPQPDSRDRKGREGEGWDGGAVSWVTACHRDVLFHLCCGENECHRAEPYDSLSSRRRSPFINALNNISSPPSPAGQSGQGTLNRMTVKCHNKNGMLTASTPLFPASLFLLLSHSFPPTSHPYTHTHTHTLLYLFTFWFGSEWQGQRGTVRLHFSRGHPGPDAH